MDKIYVVSIDEEFEKSRKPGAKDIKPRKKKRDIFSPTLAEVKRRRKSASVWR
jgi:hypothetical protein